MSVAMHSGPGTDPAARERRMGVLFEVTAAPLRRYLMRLTQGQAEAAEDLLQETMLRAWCKVDELPDDDESLRRWTFTVARNLAVDAVRSRMARPLEIYGDGEARDVPAENDVDRMLDRLVLVEALSRLSVRQRAVLESLYCRDASMSDTAESLGIPEGTVRSRTFYALRTVRGMLDRAATD